MPRWTFIHHGRQSPLRFLASASLVSRVIRLSFVTFCLLSVDTRTKKDDKKIGLTEYDSSEITGRARNDTSETISFDDDNDESLRGPMQTVPEGKGDGNLLVHDRFRTQKRTKRMVGMRDGVYCRSECKCYYCPSYGCPVSTELAACKCCLVCSLQLQRNCSGKQQCDSTLNCRMATPFFGTCKGGWGA